MIVSNVHARAIMRFIPLLQLLLAQFVFEVQGSVSDSHVNGKSGGSGTTVDASANHLHAVCRRNKKCHECIQTLGCLWCKDKDVPPELSRCFPNSTYTQSRPNIDCKNSENPQGTIHVDGKQVTGSDASLKFKGNHNIQLKLRKGERKSIVIEYTDEKNRPLDLYIVMDLSCSMKGHKTTVATLAETLANNLRSLTSQLNIGFGSFVDKPLAPFGFVKHPDNAGSSCGAKGPEEGPKPVPPYSFKNHLKLTDSIQTFISNVHSANISSNVDAPEGTLDALLQSIVCTKQIGWRTGEGNRKLVVISTDGPYHLAGDGKLVGVVVPHDGVCYVDDSTGMYTESKILDYPSISVIRQKMKENDVFVIFAVTEGQQANYKRLAEQFHPFAVTQRIDDKTNSITSVIENEYKKLVNTVTMLSEYNQKYVNIKFFAKCPGKLDFEEGNQCQDVGHGTKVSYKIEVELKDCPSSSDLNQWQSNITVYPQSSSEEAMTIQLDTLCGCDCEKEAENSQNVRNSESCSNNGYPQCGICKCGSGWGGPSCNCPDADDNISKTSCINPSTGTICSDRGECDSCGKCSCHLVEGNPEAIGGKYCECNNTDCQMVDTDKGLCNEDVEQGSCKCSSCDCNPGYEGARCECPTSNVTCQEDGNDNKICNDWGKCACGKCACDAKHTGTFCEILHARVIDESGSCSTTQMETKKCVGCLVLRNELEGNSTTDDSKKESCKEDCEEENISVVFKEQIVGSLQDHEVNMVCQDFLDDANGCRAHFIIRGKSIHTNKILLEIEKGETIRREKCPPAVPLFEIAIGIASALVLGGIILILVWKVVTHIQDKKEYARFEKSINDASWNVQNPLYESATTEFSNPAYTDFQENEMQKAYT